MKLTFVQKLNTVIKRKPIWIIGLILLCVSFIPCVVLGKNSLFYTNDQYDGALLSYILNAKYLFKDISVYPEWLNGVPKEGMTVAAPLCVLLYLFLEPVWAMIVQYILASLIGFLGMYLLLFRIINQKQISCLIALIYALLPFMPLYGHSAIGAPLLIYAFICLYENKHLIFSYLTITFFALTSSLVMLGYAYLVIGGIIILFLIKKRNIKHFCFGYILLLFIYIITNLNLIISIFHPENAFISHREDFVAAPQPFWTAFSYVFFNEDIYAPAYNNHLIIPVLIVQLIQSFRYKRLSVTEKKIFKLTWFLYTLIIFLCIQYALYYFEPIIALRNILPSAIRHFQFHRIYMFLPMLWYVMAGLCLWQIGQANITPAKIRASLISLFKFTFMFLFIFKTIITINSECLFHYNLNQLHSPQRDYGTTFNEYFMEDIYEAIYEYIGKEQNTYKVASLGIDPAIAMYNGFYCVDGYSNNYPLSYKYAFRQVIEKELQKSNTLQTYFDTWGSRCYLFSAQIHSTTPTYQLEETGSFSFQKLELDTIALKDLGCNYIFAAAPIENADNIHLSLANSFTDAKSPYIIYVYEIQ